MRPNQHNNNYKRSRNRNRRQGGGGGGGGNAANKVFDSNGPDVKLRGTAQTIAEKYMQLGRDAQSSGDPVAAESYYQFADHYYRVWLAAQPAGQPIQFSRRTGEEEFEDEALEAVGEGEDSAEGAQTPVVEGGEPVEGGTVSPSDSGEGQSIDGGYNGQNGQGQRFNRNREFRDGNREGGNRNFRQRWPRRNDRYGPQDGEGSAEGQGETRGDSRDDRSYRDRSDRNGGYEDRGERSQRFDRGDRNERYDRTERIAESAGDEADGNWEAPSFLTRPTPVVATDEGASVEERRPRRSRRPEAEQADDVAEGD